MFSTLTPEKISLIQLPILLSEAAWLQAVYITNCSYLEMNQRLNAVFECTCRELLVRPISDQSDSIDFGLYRFPPCGNRDFYIWLDLRLQIEHRDGEPCLLRVTLRDEVPKL